MKTAVVRTLLLACFALAAPVARAVPAAAGDIILGFTATGGQGVETNLEVNLGPASAFYEAAAGSTSILSRLSVEDLKAVYGDDWATRSDLFWGFAGTTGPEVINGVPARTLWASRAEDTAGTASQGWKRGSAFTLQIPSNRITPLYGAAPGSISNFPATANSAFSSKVTAAESGSWLAQEAFFPGVSFQYFNPTVMKPINTFGTAASAYDGTAYSVLDLWEMRPGGVNDAPTLVGGIGLNSAGKLVFSKDIAKFAAGGTGPVELGSPAILKNANGSVTVTLTNVPSGNYNLERTTTMVAGDWAVLLTQSPATGTLTFNDPNPPQPRGFYRIKKAP